MSERLKRFRKLMSAFEGTSNPQRAIEQGYYVNLPNSPVKEITRRVELRPSSVYLLAGGIGSGKTTQLLLAEEYLNQLEEFKAIYIDVSIYTDISEIKPGVLMTIAALEVAKLFGDSNDDELNIESIIKKIEILAYGEYIDSSDYEYYHDEDPGIYFKSGILKKDTSSSPVDQLSSELVENFEILFKTLIDKSQKDIIFIFDGLDRLNDLDIFINSIPKDVLALSSYSAGVIIVASIVVSYMKGIENFFKDLYYFPYLDITQNEETKKFLIDILKIRDPDTFITLDAKEFLAIQSGGVLRDLISLTQSAIEEAYVDGSDDVQVKHAEEAVAALARSKFIGLTDEDLNTLEKVISQKTFSPRTPEELSLLLTGHILEYRYPKRHFVVHPVLLPLLKENMSVSVAHE